jgi:hypothetical protein
MVYLIEYKSEFLELKGRFFGKFTSIIGSIAAFGYNYFYFYYSSKRVSSEFTKRWAMNLVSDTLWLLLRSSALTQAASRKIPLNARKLSIYYSILSCYLGEIFGRLTYYYFIFYS